MKYTSKFRVSRFTKIFKNNILSWFKGDVPTYILNDVRDRLDKGQEVVTISMMRDRNSTKSITDYLCEYHKIEKYWEMFFINVAFDVVAERIRKNLSPYSDIQVEIFDLSATDRRVHIQVVKKEN